MSSRRLRQLVAEKVRKARLRAELTQEQAAEITGFHYKYYQRVESGVVNLTLDSLERISRAFKVDLKFLIG